MGPMFSQMDAALEAAQQAGRVLLSQMGRSSVRAKGRSDLVTDADIASQKVIRDILTARFPQYLFLGEESGADEQAALIQKGSPIWIVDPLDGTTNYVHRMPGFSISIALVEGDRPLLGVVYDPIQRVFYSAKEGERALRNGKPIQASSCTGMDQALVCCSLRPGVRRNDPSIHQFLNLLEECQSIRRLGSAALNLCYLAEGFLDAYWATSVQCWDVAAGVLIAQQAGATVTQSDGSPLNLWHPLLLASATAELHQRLLECLNGAEGSGDEIP